MKLRTIILIVLTITLALFVFTGCGKKETYDGKIISFEYSYGGYPGPIREYKIYTENEKTYIKANGLNGIDLNLNKIIDDSVLKDISQIINENEITSWNGFNKKDSSISDGNSFSLTIKYDDGKEVSAHGRMKYPKNYETAHKALSTYLESIQ